MYLLDFFNTDVLFELKVIDFLLDFDIHLYKDSHRIFIIKIFFMFDIIQSIDYSFRLIYQKFLAKISYIVSSKNLLMPISLPNNIFELQDEDFLHVVQQQCGTSMVEILRYLEINSAACLLNIQDLFAFFRHDSPDLIPMKNKVGITLSNGNFLVKEGLSFQANTFIQTLHALQQQIHSSTSNDMTISSALLNQHPILRDIIHMFENSSSQSNRFFNTFKYTAIETIISNHDRAKTRYSYNDSIRDFASCVYILGGRNVYEFIRINIPGFLPTLTIIQHLLDSTKSRIEEGEFRYNLMSDYLVSQKTNHIFVAEDCTVGLDHLI